MLDPTDRVGWRAWDTRQGEKARNFAPLDDERVEKGFRVPGGRYT